MSSNHVSRIARVESRLMTRTCTTCYGFPVRIVCVDDDGTENGSNMPESGCPECGRPIRSTREIVGIRYEDLP